MRGFLNAIQSQIRYRIILPYLMLTLLVMMAGSSISLGLVAASQEERLTNQLAQVARNTSDALVRRENEHLLFLWQVAFAQENKAINAPSMGSAFASNDPQIVARTLEPFYNYGILNANLDFDRLIAFNTHGVSLVDWQRSGDDTNTPPKQLSGTDLSQVDFVRRIIAGEQIDGNDKDSGLIVFQPDPQSYFYTAAPVKQGDEIVGGVLIAIKIDRLIRILEKASQAAVTSIYALQGSALGNTLIDRTELADHGLPKDIPPQLSNQRGSIFTTTDINQRSYELAYSKLQVAGRFVGYFAVGLSRDFQVESVSLSRNSIIIIAMVLAVSSIFLGYLIARGITKPLAMLVNTAEAVTAGDLERRPDVQSHDELGRLAQAFNQMTAHLLQLYRTSRELSTTIEVTRVLDVTTETTQSFAAGTEVLALIEERGRWYYRLRSDAPQEQEALRHLRLWPTDPLLRELTQSRAPRVMSSTDDPRLVQLGITSITGFGSVLLNPLVVQDDLVGVLIFGHSHPNAFSGAIEPTLKAIASMAASVLYNAVLFARTQEEASERQAILQSIADGVVVCDHQRMIMLVNSAAESMLNLRDWRIVRRSFDDVPLKRVDSGLDLFGRDNAELEHYQLDEAVFRLSNAPVIAEDGHVLGEVIVLHDISAEAAVDQAKTDFIKVISHELRTPLTPICGNTELLLRGIFGELSGEQRDMLEQVRVRADQMKDLVNNIIMVASIEANTLQTEPEPQDVWVSVEQVAATMRRAFTNKGLDLRIELPQDIPPVLADREQLRLILTQLLDNARRYTRQGSVSVCARQVGDMVQIDIVDTGPGIPPEESSRLFTRFHRIEGNNSPERGSGLGLAITRQLVERQGGQVWATSEIGHGSVFSISLPIASDHANISIGPNNQFSNV